MDKANPFLSKDEHIEMKTLQEELAYYTNLLADYNSSKPKIIRNITAQNYTQQQNISQNVSYKRPGPSTFKIVKKPPIGSLNPYATNWSSSKLNAKSFTKKNKNILPNNRTISSKVWVMSSNNSLQKANSQIVPMKINSLSKRTVFHQNDLTNSKRTVLSNPLNRNSGRLDSNLSSSAIQKQPVKSVSQELMTEIITLTERLKQTSGNLSNCNKIKPPASNFKVNADVYNKPLHTLLSNKDINNHKLLVAKSLVPKQLYQNCTSKFKNVTQVPKTEIINPTINEINVKDKHQDMKIYSILNTPEGKEPSLTFNSCGGMTSADGKLTSDKLLSLELEQNGREAIISSVKKECQHVKTQFVVGSSSKCPAKGKAYRISSRKTLSSVVPTVKSQPLKKYSSMAKKKLDDKKKLIASKYKVLNGRTSYVNILKPENMLQKRYMENLDSLQLNCSKRRSSKFEPTKDIQAKPSSTRKCRKKLNLKYKIINRTMTPVNVSLKSSVAKSSKKTKQRSHIKSLCSVYKLINDNISDKEQKLISPFGSVIFSKRKANQNLTSTSRVFNFRSPAKVSPKVCRLNLVKTLRKDPHNLSSKYKVVNKSSVIKSFMPLQSARQSIGNIKPRIISPSKLIYIRKNSPGNYCPAKSKFVSMKKNLSLVNTLASCQSREKCMLLKRVYKSKNTIINKNINTTSHAARLIKTKYFALTRRKPISSRMPMLHISSGRKSGVYSYLRKNNFKGQNMAFKQRKCSYFRSTNDAFKGHFCKKKPGICARRKTSSARPSVLIIRGERFATSSSGKKLKKLSNSVQRKGILKRIAFHGKTLVRTSPNMLKTATPIAKTLASRVLHRSINRVLTASVKKKLTKVNRYCMFYNRFGRCNKGVKCSYIHDPSKIAVCTRFLRGTCKINGCPFSHEICPGKMAICSFFLLGSCNKIDCPYRHEVLSPNSELCKAFVQGYCASGKECKKAHILVCPQYIQGTCEKGDACAFPHPPQKAKKNPQQDIPSDENMKESEELVEKVTRYFQPFIEELSSEVQGASESINVVVSRSRTLPEQPSFIPLYDTPVSTRSSCLSKKLGCQEQPSCVPLALNFDETA